MKRKWTKKFLVAILSISILGQIGLPLVVAEAGIGDGRGKGKSDFEIQGAGLEILGTSDITIGYKEDVDIITFTDIKNHWAKESIEFITAKGLFTGTGQDKFSPDMPMTRGMFVTVLARLANADVNIYKENSFTDVETDAYYMGYIEWASKNNIVEGINQDNFGPDMPISREQIAVILYRYSNYKSYDTSQGGMAIREFTDYASISDYALRSMGWTVNTGILQGSDNKLIPKDNATRAEVAAILMRFSQTIE